MSILSGLANNFNKKEVRKIEKTVALIEALDDQMQLLSDDELKAKTEEFKTRLNNGETEDDILPEAFAVVREASTRVLGMKHFHVQLIAGVALHQGRLAEQATGEGKSLTATLPAYLNALSGKGVHIVTVNDYLANRDAAWMGKLYRFLGLTVGCITHDVKGIDRKNAYLADITYGTNNEFGFDYLRDNMATNIKQMVQRPLHYAIVDEVDSILIDEARTPLIISGKGMDSSELYIAADHFTKTLKKDRDFKIEEKDKQISLTEEGVSLCETRFNIDNLADPNNMELNHYINEALRANYIMKKDLDYIVKDGEVIIVDEFTGRLMYGRRFSNGLHQAIEAKEGVKIRAESKTLATITLQNYFRMYEKLAGMTGTAKTEEDEFRSIYNMDVITVPTNKPVIRTDLPDAVYAHKDAKYKAVVNKISEIHATGQPVLIGTISIEVSELLSSLLTKNGIPHNVLNAKHHEQEAKIVAEAGRLGAVTIATNMAGRGTDIILGGNPEFEARTLMEKEEYTPEQIAFATGFEKSDDPSMLSARERYNDLLSSIREERLPEQQKVKDLGGLFILGTERHESRRIDNQLRGRSGRQGDPGKTQFFLSLEDDLMKLFGGDRLQAIGNASNIDDKAIEAKILSKSIENAQKKVEGRNFGIRKYVLQYDDVMNRQRSIIYEQRQMVLNEEDVSDDIREMRKDLVHHIVYQATAGDTYPENWDLHHIEEQCCRITTDFAGLLHYTDEEIMGLTQEQLENDINDIFNKLYQEKENIISPEQLRKIERSILLNVVDQHWMDHIDAMDQLKEGIGLRGIGQQDPAVAYAKEGFEMFDEMVDEIREDTVKYCYNITIVTKDERHEEIKETSMPPKEALPEPKPFKPMPTKNASPGPQTPYKRTSPKIGRNDPCPCGSGKKYKHCCGKNI